MSSCNAPPHKRTLFDDSNRLVWTCTGSLTALESGGFCDRIHWFRVDARPIRVRKTDLATGRERQLTTGKKSARKALNTTSGAQFAALPLVKPVVSLRAPSSTDVLVLLLNQPSMWFQKYPDSSGRSQV